MENHRKASSITQVSPSHNLKSDDGSLKSPNQSTTKLPQESPNTIQQEKELKMKT